MRILVGAAPVRRQGVRVLGPPIWRLHSHLPELLGGRVPHSGGILSGHRAAAIVVGGHHGGLRLPGASIIGDPGLCLLNETFSLGFLRLLHRV